MIAPVEVRRIRDDDATTFRELRLTALREDPLAFGSTEAREGEYPAERWSGWVHRGAVGTHEATFVAVEPSHHLVGMIGAFDREGRPQLWGLWVRPTHRRRGIGRRLLEAILAWSRAVFPGVPTRLEVNPDLEDAVNLYRSHGFEFTGVEEPLGHHPPSVVREMVRSADGPP